MTEQEAIKVFTDKHTEISTSKCDDVAWTKLQPAIDMAISALEEIQQYRALGTLEELREAREKQVLKKPYIETEKATGLHEDYDCYECPNCDSFLGHVSECKDEHYRYNYCPNCGQAIDWSDAE